MEHLRIIGARKLDGEVCVFGTRNGILPMMAASILCNRGTTIIENVPNLKDISTLAKILRHLGAKTDYHAEDKIVSIDCETIDCYSAPYQLSRQMRASILLMGPLLSRFKRVEIPLPGGCAIGARGIDMHLDAFRKMGATITQKDGAIQAATSRLRGETIFLDFPTHTGTENIMSAACLASGTTTIVNAACEPEIVEVATFGCKN